MVDSIFDSLLNKTAIILRPVQLDTSNSLGEREDTTNSTEVATVPVCIQPNKEKYEIEMGGLKYWVELVAYMNIVDIQVHDRLEVDSIKYLVVGVEDEGGQGHHLKVYIIKQ